MMIDEKWEVILKLLYSMAIVAQLVRALDCGSKSRGFEPRRSPFLLLFALFLSCLKTKEHGIFTDKALGHTKHDIMGSNHSWHCPRSY